MNPEGESTNRRDALLKLLRLGGLSAAVGGAAWWLKNRSQRPEEALASYVKRDFTIPADPNLPELAVAQGDQPRALVRKAVEALGGMGRFISRGDVVVL